MSLQALISGLLLGGIYALVASGFSLISGVMKVLNFSHGALIMLGGYSTFWLTQKFGIDPFITLPITMVLLFILGFLVQKYLLKPHCPCSELYDTDLYLRIGHDLG